MFVPAYANIRINNVGAPFGDIKYFYFKFTFWWEGITDVDHLKIRNKFDFN